MTIASEITKLNTNLTNSYTACNNKGATMPANQNFDNLATCINSIQTGGGGGSTWQVVEGIITNSNLNFLDIYNPNSEFSTSGNFIYLVFDNGTLLFATPAYKNRGTLRSTGVLVLVESNYYAQCSILDEISIIDEYGMLEVQGYNDTGDKVIDGITVYWTDPTS